MEALTRHKAFGFAKFAILLVLLCLLCGCSGRNALAAYAGSYTLFVYDFEGYVLEWGDMTSELVLNANGGGSITINESKDTISQWSMKDEDISIRSGQDVIGGTLRDGVITLDFGDGSVLYYAREGADTSVVSILTREEYYDILLQSMRSSGSD